MTREPDATRPGPSEAAAEAGAIAVYVALLLPVLMVFVAIAVDISRWYVELQRIQRAADAGALAAAPYMPGSVASGSGAYVAAQRAVANNGLTMKAIAPVPNFPTKVRVTVESSVDNGFARVIGFPRTTLSRASVADFAGPVAMGSPCNLFGREDMEAPVDRRGSVDCATAGSYWVNIAGQYTNKARGDGFSSSWCTKPDDGVGIDECKDLPASQPNDWRRWQHFSPPTWTRVDTSEPQWRGAPPHKDWGSWLARDDANWYDWRDWDDLRVPEAQADPAFAAELQSRQRGLDDLNPKPGLNTAYDAFPGYVFKVRVKSTGTLRLEGYDIGWVATGDNCTEGNLYDTTDPVDPRYGKTNNAYCTGDTQMGRAEGYQKLSTVPGEPTRVVTTTVTVRKPHTNPYTPLDGEVLCTMTLPGFDTSTPATALFGTPGDAVLKRVYHQWSNLLIGTGTGCGATIAASPGDYSIQVKTTGGGGQNRFSLRASLVGGDNRNVSIFAVDRVSLFNNVPAGTSFFNLVRLDSSAAAHTLNVRFYDLGDATDPVTATVLQPDSLSPFTACTGEGPVSGTLTNCSVVTRASTNGGRWQIIRIPIASDYTCSDDNDQSKCWVRIRLSTTSGQADTTTWAADLEGDPVRIVE